MRVRAGFTLIEMLVVITAIALLVGILLPALAGARTAASRVLCLSNQRQMMLAATLYTDAHGGHFMPALYTDFAREPARRVAWDYAEVYTSRGVRIEPGPLWAGTDAGDAMQCPSMMGGDNWTLASSGSGREPRTGYNYNTSYLGGPTVGPDPAHPSGDGPRWGIDGEPLSITARLGEVGDPSWTVVFGDGGFSTLDGVLGANKFMRAPRRGTRDSDVGRAAHGAGAQAFLHGGMSNAVLADGHARSFRTAHRETYPEAVPLLLTGTGFLSAGNGLYDLSAGR